MNRKGEMAVGGLIIAFIGVIVALSLLSGGISKDAGALSSTTNIVNRSLTLTGSLTYNDISECVNYAGTMILTNSSSGADVPTTNYTTTTRVSPTLGYKVLSIYVANLSDYNVSTVNVTTTCLNQGYAESAASRSIISLVVLFAALAVVAFVLYFAWGHVKEYVM